jgi:hypothetical protein
MIRVTAWFLRFIENCRPPKEIKASGKLLPKTRQLIQSEVWWLHKAKTDAFPDCEQQKGLSALNPKRGNDGLLRASGRLGNVTDLPYDVEYPILLPNNHPITTLVITNGHAKLGNGTVTEHLLGELRTRFWIIKGRRAVRNVVERCLECRRRFRTKPAGQQMASLPEARMTLPLRAFERVGVDFGGPFLTNQGRQ